MKIVADENIPFAKDCFGSIGDVVLSSGRRISSSLVSDADILLVRSITNVNEGLLAGSRVRFVATATIGFEHVDTAYLAKTGTGFASAPGSNANSVAEYVAAAMLNLAERFGFTLEGMSIGIIGAGNVGSRVGQKAMALGMKVVLNDPPLERRTGDKKYRPLSEANGCDFVTLHTPLTRQGTDRTYHLADERFFGGMKDSAFFINTSRGAVHETAALKRALEQGQIAAAMLDVWENEPNIDNQLLEKIFIGTPHIAGYSFDGKIAGLMMIYNAACEYFNIRPGRSIADFLPKAAVPVIELDSLHGRHERIIQSAVRKIYDITNDDADMRKILTVADGQRGGYFDSLRKNYPVRREFHNTTVVLSAQDLAIAEKLAGLGFRISVK